MSTPDTFAALLDHRLRHAPGAPLITWYDDSTGERVELSATTYANWVAKTANLFLDEYLLDPGDVILIDLPNHWLVPVFLGAAWQVGLTVTDDPDVAAALVVAGPDVEQYADRGVPILACSLRPFAVRFPDGPPQGADDYGLLWPGQPDALLGAASLDPDALALPDTTHRGLVRSAGGADWEGGRLLTDLHPLEDPASTLMAALTGGGSLVLVHDASPTSWTSRSSEERATAVRRRDGDPQPSAEKPPKPFPR